MFGLGTDKERNRLDVQPSTIFKPIVKFTVKAHANMFNINMRNVPVAYSAHGFAPLPSLLGFHHKSIIADVFST